ncbi:MAG TPA: hypothetical protein VHN20_02990 [Beijerinckiaceae bacterium]|nr:hypothetical protein [Beijerinckiaceae bacterium]
MRIRYSRRAQADLDAIFSYLNERSPDGGEIVILHVRDARRAPWKGKS